MLQILIIQASFGHQNGLTLNSLMEKYFTPKENGGKLLIKPGEHLGLKNFENYNALNNKWNQCEIIVNDDTNCKK